MVYLCVRMSTPLQVPDVRQINDTGSYAALCDAVFYTSIAWVITDEDKYADRAIEYIRAW
jgi:hypothetical protein